MLVARRSPAWLGRRLVRTLQSSSINEPPTVIQFKCTQCGKCCTGSGGRVRVNERERAALARELGVSRDEFTANYLTKARPDDGEATQWLLQQNADDTQCIFLEGTKCSVYNARPTQCRTFPWWPQHLVSNYDWQLAARQCEGITINPDERDREDDKNILRETIVYDIHRSGENYTYDELHEMLGDLEAVDPSFMDAYAAELREKFYRRLVYQDAHVTVLDTFIDGVAPTRCFVFNDRLHLVQSEMNLTSDGQRIDASVLVLDVHRAMSQILSWLSSRKAMEWKIAVLGSGGGSLVRYLLHTHGKNVEKVEAVEPNATVNDVARRFFGMDELDNVTLYEEFGEVFVDRKTADTMNYGTYDLLFLDVEAGSPGDGILAPPESMLTKSFLSGVCLLLSEGGFVAINVITENDKALQHVATQVYEALPHDVSAAFVTLPRNTVIYLIKNVSGSKALGLNTDNWALCPLSELLGH